MMPATPTSAAAPGAGTVKAVAQAEVLVIAVEVVQFVASAIAARSWVLVPVVVPL